jgi:lipoyl-dependent peroxiredoxin
MPTRTSSARWEGTLKDGSGQVALGSGAYEGPYSFMSRFEDGGGTNPEELIAAAHAGCFSMALANALSQAGHTVNSVATNAKVQLTKGEGGFGISRIDLDTTGNVEGIDEAEFQKYAETAKETCIVSRALSAVPMTLEARLACHPHRHNETRAGADGSRALRGAGR